jgi:hypothetical protein
MKTAARRSNKSVFEVAVGQFAEQMSATLLADPLVEPGSRSPFEVLKRFQVDLRAQSIWEWLDGDEITTASFLEALKQALIAFWCGDLINEVASYRTLLCLRALQEMHAMLESCKELREIELGDPGEPRLPDGFEEQLRSAGQQICNKSMRNDQMFEPLLQKSRKAAPRLLERVHFPCLLVTEMQARFGRPFFQLVADATTILFGLKSPLSVNSVRKAWLRHGTLENGLFARRKS